ncbi:uncharacterized protein LOC128546347 [Mercenaria mercenaria]|uniref:uncharacterized protein LOC128546347 n=1 Tax=Mercenaria mercenaria TaxID=6596 RepID=UPI00234F5563|nr:uncharacterized protein LOC128546347 [Mercenaria mercenaria]
MFLNIQLQHIEGKPGEYAEDWLESYDNYCTAMKIDNGRKWSTFAFMLKGHAYSWYKALPTDVKNNPDEMMTQFKNRFNGSDGLPPDTAIYSIKQYEHEPVCDYITRITDASWRSKLQSETIAHLASEGLVPEIQKMVMPQSLKTLEDVRKAALAAERCVLSEKREIKSVASAETNIDQITDKVCEQVIAVLSSKFNDTSISQPLHQLWSRHRHQNQMLNEHLSLQSNYNMQPPLYQQQYCQPQMQMPQQQIYPQQSRPQQNKQDRQKPCRNCGGFYGSRWLLTLLVLVLALGCSEESLVVQRLNYGVVFTETTDLVIACDNWLHTFEILLPQNLDMPSLPPCRSNNQSCVIVTPVLAQLNSIRTETALRLNDTLNTMLELIPETRIHKSRSKRTLLPFIGDLTKGLFGTATMEDVNIFLAKHMNKLAKMNIGLSKAFAQHEDHISSFISSADERMDNLLAEIKENMLAIKFIQSDLYTTQTNFEHVIGYLMDILIDEIKTTSKLNIQLEEFKIGISNLVDGKLSPFLISEDLLRNTLKDIQTLLETKYTGFHLAFRNIADVYSNCKLLFARNGTNLYVTLKLPISHLEKPLKLFKVKSVPVPINSTSKDATQLLNLPKFFAVSSNQQHYTTLDSSELEDCNGKTTKLCTGNFALSPVTSSSCILALYANDKVQIKSLCNFRYVHDIVKPKILELSPNSLLLYRTPLLSMVCHNQHKMVTGCDFCIFSLPCRCSVSTNDFYFIPRLGSCHKRADNITVLHPVNLALLQHFFETAFVDNIFADTTFKTAVNVSVPNLNFYEHQMSNIIAADTKAHLSLQKMSDVAKKDGVIFKSLTEPLLDGEIEINSNWPTTFDIITYCLVGVSTVLSILLVLTILRVRKLSLAVAVLTQSKSCKALQTTVPSFIYKPVGTDNSNNDVPFTVSLDLTWEHANFIVLTFIVVTLLGLLYKYLKNRHRATLCLKVHFD